MNYLGLYIKEVIKGIIVWIIISAIAIYFYPNKITLIILAVIFLGIFAAASEAVKAAKTEETNNENLNLENTELNKTNMTSKLPTKEDNSIFDDIELD